MSASPRTADGARPPDAAAFSALLSGLTDGLAGESITFGAILERLHDRAFGILALLLALPNALPGPAIPGFSLLFGLPLAVLGLQMAAGRPTPWLPPFLARRAIARTRLETLLAHAVPRVRPVERLFRPRYPWLAGERRLGLVLTLLALVMSLPVPLGNLPVALSILIIALGLIAGDGLAVLAGILAGVAAALWNAFLLFAGAHLVHWLVGRLF